MTNIYIGIDPGVTGFFTLYSVEDNQFKFYAMPKIGKFVDLHKLNQLIRGWSMIQELNAGVNVHACFEDVHSKFGSSAKANFTFGGVNLAIEALLIAHDIPFTKVQPKKWQAQMWQGIPVQKKLSSTKKTMVNDTKLMSKMAAKRLFPTLDLRRTEKCTREDDNKIDSLLLCEYARRNF